MDKMHKKIIYTHAHVRDKINNIHEGGLCLVYKDQVAHKHLGLTVDSKLTLHMLTRTSGIDCRLKAHLAYVNENIWD